MPFDPVLYVSITSTRIVCVIVWHAETCFVLLGTVAEVRRHGLRIWSYSDDVDDSIDGHGWGVENTREPKKNFLKKKTPPRGGGYYFLANT